MQNPKAFKKSLVDWYGGNKRDLPWRATNDPYKIWISEVMLQQTTVVVVVPYFEKFVAAFPTVRDLAKAKESRVLSLWSGLGYYSRAKNLHRAAKVIAGLPSFPGTYEELLRLPGIGPYTAAAVASIAFDEETPCVDGNVARVISRLYDIPQNISTRAGLEIIRLKSRELIRGQPPSIHNQAMMELGATLCTPKNPSCLLCPAVKFCEALKADSIHKRPVKKKNRKQEPWLWELHLVKKDEKIAFVKNKNGTPWLKNTWVLPGIAKAITGRQMPKSTARHSITHHKIYVKLKHANRLPPVGGKIKWVRPSEISNLGISSVVQKVLKGVLLSVLFLNLSSCKTAQKQSQTAPSASPTSPGLSAQLKSYPVPTPLTSVGDNERARFSSDGQKLIFESSDRPTHKNSQIYTLNLKTGKEKRITFNDGNDTSAAFDSAGTKIIYASSTDEQKEHPEEGAAASEIYESGIDGSHIRRLTNSEGFDGDCVFSKDSKHIYYSSIRNDQTQIRVMNADGTGQRQLAVMKEGDTDQDSEIELSPDGKRLLWTAAREDKPGQHLYLADPGGRKPITLTTREAIHRDPFWSPDGTKIIFAANRVDKNFFGLYTMSIDGTCLKRISTNGDALFPAFSPDGKTLVFTSKRSGMPQIYIMDFNEPTDCLSEAP